MIYISFTVSTVTNVITLMDIEECVFKINQSNYDSIESKIDIIECIKHLFMDTEIKLIDSLKNGTVFDYYNIETSVFNFHKQQTFDNDEIPVLTWVLTTRIHLLKNFGLWVSNVKTAMSIKNYKNIYLYMESIGHEIKEDEFLYMSLSQVYKDLLILTRVNICHENKIDILQLEKCVKQYYDRTCILLNLCYDDEVLDIKKFLHRENSIDNKLKSVNMGFANQMYYIFMFFQSCIDYSRLNPISNELIKTKSDTTCRVEAWLMDNMSKCETFDDMTTYYSKFYMKYKLIDIDYIVYNNEDNSEPDEYSLYCSKFNKMFELNTNKDYVSSILKAGTGHKEYNAACIFSLDHLLKQYIDRYSNNLCGYGTCEQANYIVKRCPLRKVFTCSISKTEKCTYYSFIECFSKWFDSSTSESKLHGDIKALINRI